MPINYIHIFEKSITLEFTVSGHRIKQFELIMNRLYFILLLLSSSLFLGAQNNDSTIFILSTDSKIENFDKYLSLRPNVNNDVEIFSEYRVNETTQKAMFIVWEIEGSVWVMTNSTDCKMGKNPVPTN